MSVIDVENAKQIRDPMTVLVKMEVPEDVSVSYSDFVDVKIKDEELAERSWPMRALADLQGDGFALDGSHALYDPAVTASAANGKIGVRGDIGADLQFEVTGDSTINGLSIAATGADSVIYNGHTAYFSDGQVIIPVGANSIVLEFPAAEPDERVEVSLAMPGTSLQVTNDSIISCIVSLRSDLTIDKPTLPESEINIEIYNDVDISEVVASIPDDTPITYSAGYVGDMSPERKFYISGQVTWADNILSIHAVDAVHFLDVDVEPAAVNPSADPRNRTTPTYLIGLISVYLNGAGIDIEPETWSYLGPGYNNDATALCMVQRNSLRDIIAFMNNVFKVDGIDTAETTYRTDPPTHSFWVKYVDAGIPKMTTHKSTAQWSIFEEDVSEPKKAIETPINSVQVQHYDCMRSWYSGESLGSLTWQKGGPAFVNIDGNVSQAVSRYRRSNGEEPFIIDGTKLRTVYILPMTDSGNRYGSPQNSTRAKIRARYRPGSILISIYISGQLMDGETPQNIRDYDGALVYTQVIPKNARFDNSSAWLWRTMTEAWTKLTNAGIIDAGATDATFDLEGIEIITSAADLEYSTNRTGRSLNVEELINGTLNIYDAQKNVYMELFPKEAYKSMLNRSNITGSFIWKGDPRMQPRDVAEFHRLDGSVDVITLENITLHHEGGGTYAEITYREGVC